MHQLDRRRSDRGVELEADFEDADVLFGLVDEPRRGVEVCNIERERDARPWVVLRHESPQQRYGAD